MGPTPGTDDLARELAERRVRSLAAPALFLGAACSQAAHAPRVADTAREVFAQLREDEELASPMVPPADASDAEIVAAFRKLVLTLPPIQRRALALHAASGLPVPQFLQDMALLVRDGLFARVLTSAFDALAERALTLAGLRSGQNLHVRDVGDELEETGEAGSGVVLTKIHGMRVPGPIGEPIVVVGHEPDDAEILDALAVRGGESLWWVGLDAPPPGLDGLRDVRPVHVITLHPDRFFGELAVLAVQMPAVNALSAAPPRAGKLPSLPLSRTGNQRSVSAALTAVAGTAPPPGSDEFERQFLEGRLRRSEEILGRIQLLAAAPSSTVDSTLDRQLAYQRHEIALAEEKLRGIGAQRDVLLGLLREIEAAPEASRDGAAVAYLRDTIARIRDEYDGAAPDEDVVSAALATIGVLGTRLGVAPALLHKLDSFVPSAQGIAS
jgi:hypothetical protein